jgi:hypothetical protein
MSFNDTRSDREAQDRLRARAGRSMELLRQEFERVSQAEADHAAGIPVVGRLAPLFPSESGPETAHTDT